MKSSTMAKFSIILCSIFFSLCVAAQQPVLIKVNAAAVTYTIKKTGTNSFMFALVKNKTYTISAEQKGIDLTLTLKTKAGNKIQYHDSTNGAYGPEIIRYKADSTATYFLTVAPLNDSANTAEGRFAIQVKETQPLDKNTHIVTILSPKQMKADLEVFKAIREKANSGLYRYRTKEQIDSIYNWAGSRITKPLSILAFYRIIVVLADFEGSCHNWTGLPYDIKYYLPQQKGYFPFYLKYIEGKMVINNANKAIPLGSRIISINGVADTAIMNALAKYRTTDGYNVTEKKSANVKDRFGQKYQLEFGTHDNFVIQYTPPHSTVVLTKTVNSISFDEQDKNYAQRNSARYDSTLDDEVQDSYSFKMVSPSTGLLSVRTFTMADGVDDPAYKVFSDRMDSIFKTLNTGGNIKNLIVDVRNNPGGSGDALMKAFTYLANSSFKENTSAYINFNKVPFPEYFDWGSADKDNQLKEQQDDETRLAKDFPIFTDGKYFQNPQLNPAWQPDSNRFKGKVYLLVNEYVASAASHFASLVKAYTPNVTIAGVETVGGYYGHNGHIPVTYILPNSKIKTKFSIVFVTQDAPEKADQPFGRGIMPDREVSQSFDDFLNNRDTQLEYVLKLAGVVN